MLSSSILSFLTLRLSGDWMSTKLTDNIPRVLPNCQEDAETDTESEISSY